MGFKEARQVIEILESAGYPTRYAGGCVRDKLCGKEPADIDLATVALPEESIRVLSEYFKIIPTGIRHGTITAVLPNSEVEITTLRVDNNCDGRHAEVAFTDNWEADASRRDFTINAMYQDKYGSIYDYFNGQEDLKNGRIRFVGDADERIKEDYLRILRYFRFQVRYGKFEYGKEEIVAIKNNLEGLQKISQERITSELKKILNLPAYNPFRDEEILKSIVPEGEIVDFLQQVPAIVRFSQLIYKNGPKKAETIARRMRFSNKEIKQVKFLCTPLAEMKEPADAMDLLDELRSLNLNLKECSHFWDSVGKVDEANIVLRHLIYRGGQKDFPMSGKHVVRKGFSGKIVGDILKILKRSYRNGEWKDLATGIEMIQIVNSSKEELALYLTDQDRTKRELAKIGMRNASNKN